MVSSSGWACTRSRLRSVMRQPYATVSRLESAAAAGQEHLSRRSHDGSRRGRRGKIGPVTDDSFPRLQARTARFTLGRPRNFTVSADGRRILFLRSRGGTDRVTCLWRYDVETATEELL